MEYISQTQAMIQGICFSCTQLENKQSGVRCKALPVFHKLPENICIIEPELRKKRRKRIKEDDLTKQEKKILDKIRKSV